MSNWLAYDDGRSIGKVSTEGGVILLDEEHERARASHSNAAVVIFPFPVISMVGRITRVSLTSII